MRLILTHEQADFDAIAALYAAHLLDEGASPVLPRRINRNARSFLALYGAEFPFLEARDLPPGAVEMVTLVDTQSLVTLKGMGERTRVRVFDHHPLRKNTPAEWEVTVFDLGATTTFLVEALHERGALFTPLQATLLLLGIYEDTGSLTYSRTTARDARAVAWLLEQGADLGLAVRFLNPPLSPEQREFYDRLVAAAETHEINGHRVVLACGEAQHLTEEISSLAHKLRDLFEPDALFVLAQTGEGIRLVARSTTDDIDVAAIAARFGGGGHNRAAAALIKHHQMTLSQLRDDLLTVLPAHIRPPVTVAQVMSRRPRLLAPETSVQEAAQLMTRYGYEGFPVAREGKIIGLLTRRAVDRALSHRLNLPAASLMEAGEVTVYPGDSLQRVQTLMVESGWGQIPVVEPESGKVIGIVTRTDLLKTLARRSRSPQPSYAQKLERALPPERLALLRAVAEEAAHQHVPVYIVGGFVRDLLLDRPSLDFDIVVEGDAIALARALQKKHGGRVTSHSRFGTAKWHLEHSTFDSRNSRLDSRDSVFDQPGSTRSKKRMSRLENSNIEYSNIESLDLISSRQEFYEHPTALPTVERGSIKLDLHRRDFTINTLALRLDGRHFGELHDYYGGLADLQRGRIRVLHSLSFIDDPTRMLRAVRYEQRYGFHIEPRTLQLMDEARPLIARLSHERVRHELDLIADEPNAPAMLARLAELNLLAAISEALPWNADLRQRLDSAQPSPPPDWGLPPAVGGLSLRAALTYLLWLLDLPAPLLERLHERLRFSLGLYKALRAASALRSDLPGLRGQPASAWVRRLEDVPLAAVYAVFLASRSPDLEQYALRWRHVHPRTTGETLKALGLPPGPAYQRILWHLRAAWLDGAVTSAEQETALLHELLRRDQ